MKFGEKFPTDRRRGSLSGRPTHRTSQTNTKRSFKKTQSCYDFEDNLGCVPESILEYQDNAEQVKKVGPISDHNAIIKEEPETLIELSDNQEHHVRFAGDNDKVSPFDIGTTVPKKALAINRNLTQERPNESDVVPREVGRPKSIMKKKKTDENSINKYKIDINKINADIKN